LLGRAVTINVYQDTTIAAGQTVTITAAQRNDLFYGAYSIVKPVALSVAGSLVVQDPITYDAALGIYADGYSTTSATLGVHILAGGSFSVATIDPGVDPSYYPANAVGFADYYYGDVIQNDGTFSVSASGSATALEMHGGSSPTPGSSRRPG
jgi:hypothetical protein